MIIDLINKRTRLIDKKIRLTGYSQTLCNKVVANKKNKKNGKNELSNDEEKEKGMHDNKFDCLMKYFTS